MKDPNAQQMYPPTGSLREWVVQDWAVNAGVRHSQLLLAWFRLAQWAFYRWGAPGRIISFPYNAFATIVMGIEVMPWCQIGPRIRLPHPQHILITHHGTVGPDCMMRHNVTIGTRVGRGGIPYGRGPTIGAGVEFGTGVVMMGELDIGDHARIGSNSVVIESIPAGGVVAGNPARLIRIDDLGQGDGKLGSTADASG